MKEKKEDNLSLLESLITRNKEKKKQLEKSREKYWKLSSIERIDYNNHLRNIKEETEYSILPLTNMFIKWDLIGLFIITLFYYISGMDVSWLENGFNIFFIFYRLTILMIFVDIFLNFLYSYKRKKIIKQLKKRFKLI